MEGLAAVSLAGNILQFLDFVGTVVSKTREVYTSTTGGLREHEDIGIITKDLKGLNGRLQTSTDPVLDKLCTRCSEVAEELLVALARLAVKGKHNAYQSFRKTLKALWGKEKLRGLEDRLAGFRQELTLYIIVDMRTQINNLASQQETRFQDLDNATKQSVERVLRTSEDQKEFVAITTKEQTEELRAFHAKTQLTLTQEIGSAASKLEGQNERTLALTVSEQQRSQAEILAAITDANSAQSRESQTSIVKVFTRVKEENEGTRTQIVDLFDANQEVMEQRVRGLERGLRHLEKEINRRADELKDLVMKINTTREGPDRRLLRDKGNSVNVILMSLYELYASLQMLLKPLLRQAISTFGAMFLSSSKEACTTEVQLEAYDETAFSVSMYFAFYYKPLFRSPASIVHPLEDSELFSRCAMEELVKNLDLNSGLGSLKNERFNCLPEDCAIPSDQISWTLTALIACLNVRLTPERTILVMSTALSVRYDPRCILPTDWTIELAQDGSATRLRQMSDIPSSVRRYFAKGCPSSMLRRPRFGLDSTLGRRLAEDTVLLSTLAQTSGLQGKLLEHVAKNQSADPAYGSYEADLTLALIGIISQSWPWQVRTTHVKDGNIFKRFGLSMLLHCDHSILLHCGCLYLDECATYILRFFRSLEVAGISIVIEETYAPDSSEPKWLSDLRQQRLRNSFPWYMDRQLFKITTGGLGNTIRYLEKRDRDEWYASRSYIRILKDESWWPSLQDYERWVRDGRDISEKGPVIKYDGQVLRAWVKWDYTPSSIDAATVSSRYPDVFSHNENALRQTKTKPIMVKIKSENATGWK